MPAEPLTEEQAKKLCEPDSIERVLIPSSRPKRVLTTSRGELPGTITSVWLVKDGGARNLEFRGTCWVAYDTTDMDTFTMLQDHMSLEEVQADD